MPLTENFGRAGAYSHLGITFAVSILAGFFGGLWIDRKIGTEPLFAIILALLGAAGGFINLVQTLKNIQQKIEEEEKEDQA